MTAPPADSIGLPTLDEVRTAVQNLRHSRAAGPGGIPLELVKYAIAPVSKVLHELFFPVWQTGHVPVEWNEGIILALNKGKISRNQCPSYRPITLLSVPGNVFADVILVRFKFLLVPKRRPQQSGFTLGRFTVEAILALRLRSEIHR